MTGSEAPRYLRRLPHPTKTVETQPFRRRRFRLFGRSPRLTPTLAFLIAACGAGSKQPLAPSPSLRRRRRGRRHTGGRAPARAPVDASGLRTAIDLFANRVHAVAHRDGRLAIDAGGLDFFKYVDGGWKTSWLLGEKDEGKPASLVAGLSALVFLPVDADGDGGGSGSSTQRCR